VLTSIDDLVQPSLLWAHSL